MMLNLDLIWHVTGQVCLLKKERKGKIKPKVPDSRLGHAGFWPIGGIGPLRRNVRGLVRR